jgi:hypothetical protein
MPTTTITRTERPPARRETLERAASVVALDLARIDDDVRALAGTLYRADVDAARLFEMLDERYGEPGDPSDAHTALWRACALAVCGFDGE